MPDELLYHPSVRDEAARETLRDLFDYDRWPSRQGQGWGDSAAAGQSEWDNLDFHVDLGCGTIPKARIGVDRFAAPGVAVIADLDQNWTFCIPEAPGEDAKQGMEQPIDKLGDGHEAGFFGLPFVTSSVKSIISHHAFEHIGGGFITLMKEVHRVLEPGGILRVIVPLFPSTSAVADPDHRRYFMAMEGGSSSFESFLVDDQGNSWMSSFSVPYPGEAKFQKVHIDMSPPTPVDLMWGDHDHRELRIALRAWKPS